MEFDPEPTSAKTRLPLSTTLIDASEPNIEERQINNRRRHPHDVLVNAILAMPVPTSKVSYNGESSKRVKGKHALASRYVDLTATVDRQGGDDDEEDDEDYEEDFIQDKDDESLNSGEGYRRAGLFSDDDDYWLHDDLDGSHGKGKELYEIARDFQERARRGQYVPEEETGALWEVATRQGPTNNDHRVWRVRVKAGCEARIATTMMNKAIKGLIPKDILSVFTRDAMVGYIYVETTSVLVLRKVLSALPFVVVTRNGPIVEVVSWEEAIQLLDMAMPYGKPPKEEDLYWVRISSSPSYKGDLGLVIGWDEAKISPLVLLVPRINFNLDVKGKKRKARRRMRPSPALFNSDLVKASYGDNKVATIGTEGIQFEFKHGKYEHGLLKQQFAPTDITDVGVNPMDYELELFAKSHHPRVECALKARKVVFRRGDAVKIVAGQFQNCLEESTGIVQTVDEGGLVTVLSTRDGLLVVTPTQLKKAFKDGDYVQVVHGSYRGVCGYVVGRLDSTVKIYLRENVDEGRGLDDRFLGQELTFDDVDLDWAITPEVKTSQTSQTANLLQPTVPFQDIRVVDKYRGREVVITSGPLKLHHAVVTGTTTRDGKTMATVATLNQAINTTGVYDLEDLTDIRTKRTLLSGKRQSVGVFEHPAIAPPIRPGTPQWDPADTFHDFEAAWDPSHQVDPRPTTPPPLPGQWLLQKELIGSRLDVKISGTKFPPYYGGKYENECGHVTIEKQVSSVEDAVNISIGLNATRKKFKVSYLQPLRTNLNPPFIKEGTDVSIAHSVGQRVTIIGPPNSGSDQPVDRSFIGLYGTITQAPMEGLINGVLVQVHPKGSSVGGSVHYFPIASLCRSNPPESFF